MVFKTKIFFSIKYQKNRIATNRTLKIYKLKITNFEIFHQQLQRNLVFPLIYQYLVSSVT